MKKSIRLFAGIAICSAMALGAAALAGCAGNGKNKISQIDTAEEAYGFSAATAGMVISGLNESAAAQAPAAMKAAFSGGRGAVTDEDTIAVLNEYMMLAESLLSDGSFEISSGANDNAEYAQYEYKMTSVCYDINGNKLQYVSYYNSTLIGSHTEYDDDWWEPEEITDVYAVEGVMIVDGAPYDMEGRFVNETEGRESESEQMLKVTVDRAAGDYITVVQENENEDDESETEFTYSLYRGGRLYEETTMEYESERGETEIKLTVENRETGKREMFEFEKEREHGSDIIKIKTGQNGREREYIVRIESDGAGNTGYVYYTKDGDRVGRGDRRDFDD